MKVCNDRIWGLGRQGYKCLECKIMVHKRCHKFIHLQCSEILAQQQQQHLSSFLSTTSTNSTQQPTQPQSQHINGNNSVTNTNNGAISSSTSSNSISTTSPTSSQPSHQTNSQQQSLIEDLKQAQKQKSQQQQQQQKLPSKTSVPSSNRSFKSSKEISNETNPIRHEAIVSDSTPSGSVVTGGKQIGLEQFDLIKVIGKYLKFLFCIYEVNFYYLNKISKINKLVKIQVKC